LVRQADNSRDKPNANERCSRCVMFREPDRCTAVIGEISPTGWCRLFERKARNWYGKEKVD
jgi:hypothetical protein